MQKMLRLFAACLLFSIQLKLNAQPRLLDQPMIIKSCNINITVNCMHATTDLELEFYNNREREIEGLMNFNLKPHQAITGFELDLNGNYRHGSIEERWKARNAYNRIVGKRVDPALVQMIGIGQYSLNIYPVPANGTRKVKIKIEEALPVNSQYYEYAFEMFKTFTVNQVNIHIETSGSSYGPVSLQGLISRTTFNAKNGKYMLDDAYGQPVGGGIIAFKIPAPEQTNNGCLDAQTGTFTAKIMDDIPETVTRTIKKIRVYWDRSASVSPETDEKYLKFLDRHVLRYHATSVEIIPFNHKVMPGQVFTGKQLNVADWKKFIRNYMPYGATNYGALDFNTSDDAIFVFTDGRNTWGSRITEAKTPTIFVTTEYRDRIYGYNYYANDFISNQANYYYDDYNYYREYKQNITSVHMVNGDTTYLYPQVSQQKVELIGAVDEHGKAVNVTMAKKINNARFIQGSLPGGSKKVTLRFGYGNNVLYTYTINTEQVCSSELCSRLNMLYQFEIINGSANSWYQSLSFGIDNKVVCWQTAFIVLEKVEDYVQYNITPPDDLMKECMDKGFVKTDYHYRYQQMKKADEAEMLKLIANQYNNRIVQLDEPENQIRVTDIAGSFARIEQEKANEKRDLAMIEDKAFASGGSGPSATTNTLSDVVVVAAGYSANRKELGYSITRISANQLSNSMTFAQALQGKLAGVNVIANPGTTDISQIRIRGISSLTGNNQPLVVLDGLPVDFETINYLPATEISNITVIKDAAGAAIYGSRGANGAIVIQTKRGRSYGYTTSRKTKLKNAEDEDYVQEIKDADKDEKYKIYLKLREQYKDNSAFYYDMAMLFYDEGIKWPIENMLLEAAEISNNDYASSMSTAFIYEYMKEFKKAQEVYTGLIKSYPRQVNLQYNLAWAYYQDNQPDSAVQIIYRTITSEGYAWNTYDIRLKDMMLSDMNMMISLNPGKVDIRYIPQEIIKPITSELRVLMESNKDGFYSLTANEGKNKILSANEPINETRRLGIINYTAELQVKRLTSKRITLSVSHYDTWYDNYTPSLIRMINIRNYGTSSQTIQTEIISLKNQYGEVEIADYGRNP